MELMGSSKVGKTGQVTIPGDVREKLRLEKGNIVGFYSDSEGRIFIQKG